MGPEEDTGNSIEWEVRIGKDGSIRLPNEFVGAFLDDRLGWERDRFASARTALARQLPTLPRSHATTAEFANVMRLSPRTVRSLLRKMTQGEHFLRQGRRVVIIVEAARRLLEQRDLLTDGGPAELADTELRLRASRLAKSGNRK